MANPDKPYGFSPTPLVRARRYEVDATAGVIYSNDVVAMDTDGYVIVATAGSVEKLGTSMDYSAASTASTYLAVADAQEQEFICQDNAGGTPAQTDVGRNADHVATAGNATLLRSQHELNTSSLTTSTAGFRIHAFVRNPDYAIGDNSRWLVTVNEHHRGNTTGI